MKTHWIRHFTGQTFIHIQPRAVTKLLFHQDFVHFPGGRCSNRGVKEVGWWRWGWLCWVFIYPSKRNRCLPAVGEVCGSIEGFKKPLWKINVPYMLLMAVWLKNTQKDIEHLFVVKNDSSTLCYSLSRYLPLFVFSRIVLIFCFLSIGFFGRLLFLFLLNVMHYSYPFVVTSYIQHNSVTLEAEKNCSMHTTPWCTAKNSELLEQLFQSCY